MKGRLFTLVLSLFLAFGLAFGQADQDGAVQDEPTQETPAGQEDTGQDAPAGEDAAGQEGETQDGAPGADTDAAGGQDDQAQPGDAGQPMDQPADQPMDQPMDQPADQPAGEEGVAGGGQADMAADQTILQALQSNPDFSMFADAVQRAGLDMTLEQQGPYTVLAPTNQAFEQASIDVASLDPQALTELVRNHIVSGMVSADQLSTLAGVVTLLGNELAVTPATGQPVAGAEQQDGQVAGGGAADEAQQEQDPAAAPDQAEEQPGDVDPAQDAAAPMEQPGAGGAVGLSVGDATVTHEAIQTSSGVVYGIDTVLVPEGVQGVEGGGAAQPGAPEEPAQPGTDQPTTPDEEPATPGAGDVPTTPGEEPTTPGEEPTTPGEEPTEPMTPEIETPGTDDGGMGDDAGMGDDTGTGDDATGEDTGTGDNN